MCDVEYPNTGFIADQWAAYRATWAQQIRNWKRPTPIVRRERPNGKGPMIEPEPEFAPVLAPVPEDWYESAQQPPPSQEYHSTYYDDARDIPECSHRRAGRP